MRPGLPASGQRPRSSPRAARATRRRLPASRAESAMSGVDQATSCRATSLFLAPVGPDLGPKKPGPGPPKGTEAQHNVVSASAGDLHVSDEHVDADALNVQVSCDRNLRTIIFDCESVEP